MLWSLQRVNGSLDNVIYYYDSRFNLHVPQSCPGVPEYVLNPKDTWANKEAYEDMANELAMMFEANFNTKYPHMPENIRKAGPHLRNKSHLCGFLEVL